MRASICYATNKAPVHHLHMCGHTMRLLRTPILMCVQGTDDLEEAMSERLQELPPPLGRHNNSNHKHDKDSDFSFPQDMDTDAAGPSKVSIADTT